MAKVYEALRRAEEERKRRTGEVQPSVARVEWEPVAQTVRPEKKGLLTRLFSRSAGAAELPTAELNKRRFAMLQPDSYVAEQYRSLRGRIDALAAQREIRTVAVTSPMPGEGKTTASINLAAVTALSVGARVLLIDCDLRRPQIHRSLGIRPEFGLAEVLANRVGLADAIVTVEGANLEVLPVRERPDNPSELLASTRMREVLDEAIGRYDRIILDSPAALGLPDARIVAELSDGVVLIVRADVTSQQDVESTLEMVDRSRVLGLVLNGVHADQGRYGYAS